MIDIMSFFSPLFLACLVLSDVSNKKGIWIGLVSESTLLILMICAAGLACRQLAVLDINANPVSQLDDLLLFICIPSFFLYGIFSIVPAMAYSNYMALFVAILQVNILEKEIIVKGGGKKTNISQ